MNKKTKYRLMAAAYILVLFQLIVLKDTPFWDPSWLQGWRFQGWDRTHLELFFTIDNFFYAVMRGTISWEYFLKNIVGNIVLFIPLGYLLRRATRGGLLRVSLWALLVILSFESIQLFTGLGVFDVDDIFLNYAGILFGYLFAASGGRR